MLSARFPRENRHACANADKKLLLVACLPSGGDTGGGFSLSGGSSRSFGGRGVESLESGLLIHEKRGNSQLKLRWRCLTKQGGVGTLPQRRAKPRRTNFSNLLELLVHGQAKTYSSPSLLTFAVSLCSLLMLSTPKLVSAVSCVSSESAARSMALKMPLIRRPLI
jgi:hypothetical protein